MELRFLGQTYSSCNQFVETIPSDITVSFRGQSYRLRVPRQSFKSKPDIRIYRGVGYCKS